MGLVDTGLGLVGMSSTDKTNAANAQQAAEQREWQEKMVDESRSYQTEMSNTAHQREVDDLKAAGLNPILSAGGGSGASTPVGGSSPSGAKAEMKNPFEGALHAANSAADTKNKASQNDVMAANVKNIDANTKNTEEQTRITTANADLAEQEKALKTKGYEEMNKLAEDPVAYISNLDWSSAASTYLGLKAGKKLTTPKAFKLKSTKSAQQAAKDKLYAPKKPKGYSKSDKLHDEMMKKERANLARREMLRR